MSNLKFSLTLGLFAIMFSSYGQEISDSTSTNPNEPLAYDKGVVINGVKWATRNVDKPGTFATKPEDSGMFYQWNKNIGWCAESPITASDGTTKWDKFWEWTKGGKRVKEGTWTGGDMTTWERSNQPCPKGWRLPTSEELKTLAKAKGKFTELNGVKGYTFGSGSNSIFIPAAGFISQSTSGSFKNKTTTIYNFSRNVEGYIWSDTKYKYESPSEGHTANTLFFDKYNVMVNIKNNRSPIDLGLSCRCVAE